MRIVDIEPLLICSSFGEDGWAQVRRDMLTELNGFLHLYKGVYESLEYLCHAPLPKIRGNGVATKVGDVCTEEKYPRTYAKPKVT